VKIDIGTYEASKHIVLNYVRGKGSSDPAGAIGMAASITHVPAIVCAYWIGEETGWPPKVMQSIKAITEFYGYTEIANKPPSAPK
jgi:hypothetical protein